jgi:deoxyribonuclease V
MEFPERHGWSLSPKQAVALQATLAGEVDIGRPVSSWDTLAAADISYNRFDPRLFAAVVVVKAGDLEIIESVGIQRRTEFPYVPGLLSFREAPAILDAFRQLRVRPDVVLCDGQGIAHPRRLGLATHLGLWLGLPTIGCAKSRLCGTADEPGPRRGDRLPLWVDGEVRGFVLRTRDRVQPLFVSPGHRCDLESAARIVLETTRGRRLPEPARLAHGLVNALRREAGPPDQN